LKFQTGPSVSIVVNTLNRAKSLQDTLRGLLSIDYPQFEIIVVNGPSSDSTDDVLSRFATQIKIGRCLERNLSMSRNVGIALSAGEIVAFIDDDAVPHPTWLRQLTRPYQAEHVGAVGGFTIDRTGVKWQARKTICDRYGDAFYVSDFFDERPLNRPGSPYYPSLLGTNCSFRRSVLEELGGFDDVYAYYLDETDVCLRVVDSGYHVLYEPAAVVFHSEQSSDRRSGEWIPKTLFPIATSKAYFVNRHGRRQAPIEASEKLKAYAEDMSRENRRMAEYGRINAAHARLLDDDLARGIAHGTRKAAEKNNAVKADLEPQADAKSFKAVPRSDGIRIVMVSRGYPPALDAGIARWTSLTASALANRGHHIHVVTEAKSAADERITFENGLWMHAVCADDVDSTKLGAVYGLPHGVASWAVRVRREVEAIKSFGPLVVSFPIWDLEGVACIDDPSIGVVMSLHTTYALAKRYKTEWQMRPLFEALHVNKVIAAEARALREAPIILANSHAIVADIEQAYGVNFRDRVVIAPHGTEDIQQHDGESAAEPLTLRVLFAGRFEKRKGFDIAIGAAIELGMTANVEFCLLAAT
jgi:GT2 family glycosyltransferase